MKYIEELNKKTKEQLINDLYNSRVSDWADYSDGDKDPHGHGKRIPYIGWYWRNTDFVNKKISIGNGGSFIGIMENNKWGYAERFMTESEVDKFMDYLEEAFAERGKGGLVSELYENAERVILRMWDWFQTLEIEDNSY